MNELLRIETRPMSGETVQTVDARGLHAFLEVQSAFKDWIARRIDDYQFADGKDFCSFLSESSGGRPAKEYAISLDMAKELAMVERNAKGKEARAYFIACERRAKTPVGFDPDKFFNDPAAMRGVLLVYTEKVIALQATVAEQAPKVEGFDRIAAADGSFCLRDAAKALQVAPMKLNQALQAHRWIYRRVGHGSLVAYQDKLQSGFLTAKISTHLGSDGSDRVAEQVRVTAKGMARLATLVAAGFLGGNQQQAA